MPEPTSTQTSPTTAEPPSPGSPHGWRFETKQVQAGHDPRSDSTRSRAIPIYQTTSYVFDSAEQAAARFALTDLGPIYTRLNNPTNEIVENRIAALEGGAGALLTASGQAAQTLTFLTLGGAGSNIVASPSLYGAPPTCWPTPCPGSASRHASWTTLPTPGVVLPGRQAHHRLLRETIPNPRGDILDIEPVAAAAHAQGIPLVVDNTVASPFLTRPIEWGADIVVASATKFLGGHGSSVAGVIVDSGNFDFAAAPQRFPGFNTPDESYHGLVYARDLGVGSPLGANLAFVLKARTQGQRDLGFPLAPHSAFLIAQGIETLSLRMERHVDNALAVATWLEARDDVADVRYSGLASSPYYHLHRKYCPRGAGAVLAFDLPGGRQAGAAFIDALRLFSNLANIGDVRSLAVHPATTTHSQLDDAGLAASGIGAGTVRLSVGIEHIDDILADLERGLAAASGGQP
ncbi:O-acetylhomoserine aminocarboxypropyltransferase [Actinomyces lilanjuaniae]|uniref:O-acetylhomoserine aminocarboxypropyltransferase n=1 Tax=Actinomyces lilanjuaniae TaxID=2321394 RepID=A0ABN5PLJ7_9ACTO|nr:PLP-dependent transferase [Actinomyces lilanjuaniae]AYD89215.1 O-acetylhomoserine aminocarboxypropyltransferase [Actinomyces lilanjuaniae]